MTKNRVGTSLTTRKFMQTLDDKHYVELETLAKKRGITLQQFLRAVVVPEWMDGRVSESRTGAGRKLRGRRLRRRLAPLLAT